MGRALAAVGGQDARGYFAHCGYSRRSKCEGRCRKWPFRKFVRKILPTTGQTSMDLQALRYPSPKPVMRLFRTTGHWTRAALAPTVKRRKKMHKPLRYVEDPVTSIVALLVSVALGFLGLLVLMLTLALGF
jgi:hypothetical protein